ncbi:uncharacterized protein LOC115631779 [Scaptodrosophila lebanonensis]|uniref:Uncharacterized protein LOC115631779 n=1 Tax=Drosophila lebanonensis TaxID=7225 RepID=A0A6J2UAG3_DROLE|nr:uncharacterized protein LOC115631779 [Scaptodrosophila lebanonensis]
MTQRLALHQILNNQLNDFERAKHEDRVLAKATQKEKAALRVNAKAATMYSRYFNEHRDVKSTFDKIVANIHSNMKATHPPRKSVPAIPEPIAQIPAPLLPQPDKSKNGRRIKGGANSRGVITASNNAFLSIPAIKATIEHKTQKMMRRGLTEINPKNFTNQKRIREVLQQKSVLETMLMQHKRLQRDRQIIALDIKRMRQDLDRIRNKLDTSLQSLNSTRTMFTGATTPKGKKAPTRSSNSLNNSPHRRIVSHSKQKTAARSRSDSPTRPVHVTLKRQLAAPKTSMKRRSRT